MGRPHRRSRLVARPRRLVLLAPLLLAASAVAGEESTPVAPAPAASPPKTIVLGLDGLDHALTRRLLDAGRLPNLARLADDGSFFRLGTFLELCDQITRLVDIKYHALLPNWKDVGSPMDIAQWNALLRSASAYHGYRRVYPHEMTPTTVAGFVLLDPYFPRSIPHCARYIETNLRDQVSRRCTRSRVDDRRCDRDDSPARHRVAAVNLRHIGGSGGGYAAIPVAVVEAQTD